MTEGPKGSARGPVPQAAKPLPPLPPRRRPPSQVTQEERHEQAALLHNAEVEQMMKAWIRMYGRED